MSDDVWSAQDTTPADIEKALRELLIHHHAEVGADAPARVLNLIAIVDRQWRGRIENPLEKFGRYHASRTGPCAVGPRRPGLGGSEPRRPAMAARGRLIAQDEPQAGEFSLTHEHVVIDVGPEHVEY